jgi:hypothetical protein
MLSRTEMSRTYHSFYRCTDIGHHCPNFSNSPILPLMVPLPLQTSQGFDRLQYLQSARQISWPENWPLISLTIGGG